MANNGMTSLLFTYLCVRLVTSLGMACKKNRIPLSAACCFTKSHVWLCCAMLSYAVLCADVAPVEVQYSMHSALQVYLLTWPGQCWYDPSSSPAELHADNFGIVSSLSRWSWVSVPAPCMQFWMTP